MMTPWGAQPYPVAYSTAAYQPQAQYVPTQAAQQQQGLPSGQLLALPAPQPTNSAQPVPGQTQVPSAQVKVVHAKGPDTSSGTRKFPDVNGGSCLLCGGNHAVPHCPMYYEDQRVVVADPCSRCNHILFHKEDLCMVYNNRTLNLGDEAYERRVEQLKAEGMWPIKNLKGMALNPKG